ncbi:MAG: RDD family protein [Chloroflexi bacterium]|nr:MAG: RDD family protein [Chloroflexota bacterium]TME16017.1 MAG: RDD family protein [Chloroflexota bacterium]
MPEPPEDPQALAYILDRALPRLTFGLIRVQDGTQSVGPLALIRLGEPHRRGDGWVREIRGGLLAARRGGTVRTAWRDGEVEIVVDGYHPLLPRWLYRFTQRPFHHLMARLSLLQARGRVPPPGIPSPPDQRLAAAAIDVGICLAFARLLRRPVLPIVAAYHVGCWSLAGRTAGGFLTRQRLTSVDGSRVSFGQATVRLLAVPVAIFRRRALHDELAGTEVVRSES